MAGITGNYVQIKVVTWNQDSHGLFDYESKSIVISKHQIQNTSKIFRQGDNDIMLMEDIEKSTESSDSEQKYLTTIRTLLPHPDIDYGKSGGNSFLLDPHIPKFEKLLEKAAPSPNPLLQEQHQENFLIVRSLKNPEGQQKGYCLEVGDILKLGRIEYLVLELRDQHGKVTTAKDNCLESELQPYNCTTDSSMDIQGHKRMCKICLMEDNTDENFLISPCECKGSCEFVHFLCLKQWIQSKIKKKPNGSTVSYNWKQTECELCQSPLPKRIIRNEINFDLIYIQRPSMPYIILESLVKEKASEKKVTQSLFLICGTEEVIKLGRGHNCVVRISDISVSREHAFIQYNEGKFMIIDNNSQFGTLIKLTKPREITKEQIAIQVGRTVITFVVQTTPIEKMITQDSSAKSFSSSSTTRR